MTDANDIEIKLPVRPISPYLRLGVVAATTPADAVDQARLRWLRDYELILQLEGRTWQWCGQYSDGGSVAIRPGDVLLIPPGYVHGWAYRAGTHVAVHFDLHARPGLAPFANLQPMEVVVPGPRELPRVPQITMRSRGGSAMRMSLLTRVREPAIWKRRLLELVRLYDHRELHTLSGQLRAAELLSWALSTLVDESAGGHQPVGDPVVSTALAYADRFRAGRPPTVAALTKASGLGRTTFAARFLASTGLSPRAFLERRRIERAARDLLTGDRPIAAVGRAHGFEDPFHFSRVFKRVMGRSPRQHRERMPQI